MKRNCIIVKRIANIRYFLNTGDLDLQPATISLFLVNWPNGFFSYFSARSLLNL